MGDGRHRQDPRGHGRYFIAGFGVLLVLALLATGAFALYSVLTAEPPADQAAAATTTGPTPAETPTRRASAVRQPPPSLQAEEFTRPPTFALRVTGDRSYVSVRLPGGKALLNKTLMRGETARFHHPKLEVTIGDPGAVVIAVNGQTRSTSRKGVTTFTVSGPGPGSG